MEIEIKYNGKKEQVVLKSDIPYGETNDIMKEVYTTEIDETSGKTFSKFNRPLYNELRLVKFIEKAPFKISLTEIRKLPTATAIKLLNSVEESSAANVITEDEVKKS